MVVERSPEHRMQWLTRDLMMEALAANDIAHSSRARAAELWKLYRKIPQEVRHQFELDNEIEEAAEQEADDGQPEDNIINENEARVEDIDENEARIEDINEDEDNESEGSGTVNTLPDSIDEADAELRLLRKQEEVLLLRERIHAMKKRDAARVKEARERAEAIMNENVAAVEVDAAVEIAQMRANVNNRNALPREFSPIVLPQGVRMAPYPGLSPVILPEGSRRG